MENRPSCVNWMENGFVHRDEHETVVHSERTTTKSDT